MINCKKQGIKSLCDNKIDVHEGVGRQIDTATGTTSFKMEPNRFLKNPLEANVNQVKQNAIRALRNI